MRRLAGFLALVFLVGCSSGETGSTNTPVPAATRAPVSGPCGQEDVVVPMARELSGLVQTFEDVVAQAEVTAQDSLSPLVDDMQSIYQDVEELNLLPCLDDMHEAARQGMALILEGYLDYLETGSTSGLRDKVDAGARYFIVYSNYEREFLDLFED